MRRLTNVALVAVLAVSAVAVPAVASKGPNPIRVLDRKISRLSAKVGQLTADTKKVQDTTGDFDTRLGRQEQIAASWAPTIRGIHVGDFPDGQVVTISSQVPDGGGPPQPVNGATVETRHADCPGGSTYMGGGYKVDGADGTRDFGWQIEADVRRGNGHEITIRNRNATPITLTVEAYCIG